MTPIGRVALVGRGGAVPSHGNRGGQAGQTLTAQLMGKWSVVAFRAGKLAGPVFGNHF